MRIIDNRRYKSNVFSIKKYTDDYYQFIFHEQPVMQKGANLLKLKPPGRDINDVKLSNHIIRAKNKIFEYSLCNTFDYFMTLTLNEQKQDRHDLPSYKKNLGQLFRNERTRINADIQYLLIPEPHKDKAWHMHGLLKGLPKSELVLLTLEDKLPLRVRQLIMQGRKIYTWPRYVEKFGWCTLEIIESQIAVSKYITKYVSKGLTIDSGIDKEQNLYIVSRGLKTAVKVKEGVLPRSELDKIPYDYKNDYIVSKVLTGSEYNKLLHDLLDYIIP